MELAGVQHDLYFVSNERPAVSMGRYSTLGWIWESVRHQAARRRRSIPWIDRNFERMQKIDGFSHKLLQVPHEHIAAYHRWKMPRVKLRTVIYSTEEAYPTAKLDAWRAFLVADIPVLLSSNEALTALAKLIVYRQFEAGDEAYYEFQDILMRRYGFDCVATTWCADEVRDRALASPGEPMKSTNQRGANA